jgi:hypothetical protein
MSKEDQFINLNIDGEQRQYKLKSLSEAAKQKIAQVQFYNQQVASMLSEVIRLVQLGNRVDQGELTSLLPEDFEIVQQAVNTVSSDEKNTNGEDSSKKD